MNTEYVTCEKGDSDFLYSFIAYDTNQRMQ